MLPDVVWHAVAFKNGFENWLLEFGGSD